MAQPAGDEGSAGPDPRARLVDPDTALRLVLGSVTPIAPAVQSSEASLGSVLVETIVADGDHPPFDRSMMDGFAVRLADAGRVLSVAGEVPAGKPLGRPLPDDAVVAIMTGAECPDGTEAVVPLEDAERMGDRVRLPHAIEPLQHVSPRGSDRAAGAAVLHAGTPITPLRLGLLHAVGRTTVLARPRPTIAIISTGDELVPADRAPGPGQVRTSNGAVLAALAQAAGVQRVTQLHARDRLSSLRAALDQAESHDVVVLVGGVSTGRHDLVPAAVDAWGCAAVFHGVSQKPGKPMLFATRGRTLVFGLPGNPLAAHLGFHRYVIPALRALAGADPGPSGAEGRLSEPVSVSGTRSVFRLCRVTAAAHGWTVTPLPGEGSADLFTAADADAIARFDPGGGPYRAGDEVPFEWLVGVATPRPEPAGPDGARPDSGRDDGGRDDLLAPIVERRSLRDFGPGPVRPDTLRRLFEAARWAPSSGNGQPWRFVITDNGDPVFDRLALTLKPRNDWARGAPHLVLVAAKQLHEHPTKPPKPNRLALLETGLAIGNLMLQGTHEDVVVHALDGFDEVAAGAAVGVPDGFVVCVLLAIGPRRGAAEPGGEASAEPETSPRQRLDLPEFVFRGAWGAGVSDP